MGVPVVGTSVQQCSVAVAPPAVHPAEACRVKFERRSRTYHAVKHVGRTSEESCRHIPSRTGTGCLATQCSA